ncbi:NAD(P)/FAD-dependent oxidoreductase [Candidatus Bathyarchaeota archaeon]|nr:NAD(P)/FAD-dependent oxidoreductase [Candidatus Bathyarchaeota archaeon]
MSIALPGLDEMSKRRYDVVVAGAGVAGSVASKLIAERGFKVALIESRPSSSVGTKVCGDGVGIHEFNLAGVALPRAEVERTVRGVKFYSPPENMIFAILGPGVTLNRHAFGQRLLQEAQDQGVEFFSESAVTRALLEEDKVAGVVARHLGRLEEFRAAVTIDATGITAAVRKTLPPSWPVAERLDRSRIGVGYREYRRVTSEFEDYCSLYYDWEAAPGGYCWIIPKKGNLVNTGLLVPWSHSIATGLESRFEKFLRENSALRDSEFVRSEIGLVPLDHPLPTAVAGGFLTIGDAACHANPLNGDGIGPAMLSAKIAADVVGSCLGRGVSSVDALWRFNVEYMRVQGHRYSGNRVFSDFMRGLKAGEVVSLLKALGVKKEYTSGDLFSELSYLNRLQMILRVGVRPRFISHLLATIRRMRAVSTHCREYPTEPSRFNRWRTILDGYIGTQIRRPHTSGIISS